MFQKNAIETVGNKTLLIKNNKVIGEVIIVTMVGMVCGVAMIDAACKDLVKETKQIKLWEMSVKSEVSNRPYRYSYFHFNIITGEYVGDYIFHNDFREKEEALEGCFVVDKFNFDFGLCHPDIFSSVEGFGNLKKHP